MKGKKIDKLLLNGEICNLCGKENVPWSAPDDLWKQISKEYKKLILCPKCFVKMSKRVLPENQGIGFNANIFYK